jgi:mRNA interferase RelE/StbE
MAWKVELSEQAEADLAGFDNSVAKRILNFLFIRLAAMDDPRAIGEALKGHRLGTYWKYRI